jgi:hypothetical protein
MEPNTEKHAKLTEGQEQADVLPTKSPPILAENSNVVARPSFDKNVLETPPPTPPGTAHFSLSQKLKIWDMVI